MSISLYFNAFALAAMPIAALAQAPSAAADPNAAFAPYKYASAFESYQSMAEEGYAPASPANVWCASNEEVARIGGHAGYMRSAQAAPASAVKDGPANQLPFSPHSGHTGHHGGHHH